MRIHLSDLFLGTAITVAAGASVLFQGNELERELAGQWARESGVADWTSVLVGEAIGAPTWPRFSTPSILSQGEDQLWTVVGNLALKAETGEIEQQAYRALVRKLCDDVKARRCWQLSKLELDGDVLVSAVTRQTALAETQAPAETASNSIATDGGTASGSTADEATAVEMPAAETASAAGASVTETLTAATAVTEASDAEAESARTMPEPEPPLPETEAASAEQDSPDGQPATAAESGARAVAPSAAQLAAHSAARSAAQLAARPAEDVPMETAPADEVTADDLATDLVAADEIAADEVAADEIAADEVTADEVTADEVTTDEVTAADVTEGDVAEDEVTVDEATADEVTTDEATANEVTEDEIAASAEDGETAIAMESPPAPKPAEDEQPASAGLRDDGPEPETADYADLPEGARVSPAVPESPVPTVEQVATAIDRASGVSEASADGPPETATARSTVGPSATGPTPAIPESGAASPLPEVAEDVEASPPDDPASEPQATAPSEADTSPAAQASAEDPVDEPRDGPGNVTLAAVTDAIEVEGAPSSNGSAAKRETDAAVSPESPESSESIEQPLYSWVDPRVMFPIQRSLKSMGFDIGLVDGVLGPRTREAIRQYQANNGLTVDGIVSEALLQHIQQSPQELAAATDQPGDQLGDQPDAAPASDAETSEPAVPPTDTTEEVNTPPDSVTEATPETTAKADAATGSGNTNQTSEPAADPPPGSPTESADATNGAATLAAATSESGEEETAAAAAEQDAASKVEGPTEDQADTTEPEVEIYTWADPSLLLPIQRYLTTMGFRIGRPDGILGPRTREAIRRYQQDNGLPIDGTVTQALKRHMEQRLDIQPAATAAAEEEASGPPELAALPEAPPAAPSILVQQIQERLRRLGYNIGAADGLLGPKTREAISTFQWQQDLTIDGLPSYQLLIQMDRALDG